MQAEVKRLATKVDNFRGDGVSNNRYSMSIAQTRGGRGGRRSETDDGVWMKITAATIDSTNRRWTYTVSEVKWSTAFTWTAVTGGASGSAYNTIEVPNGATGSFGNGVSSTNLTGTFALAPLGTNAIVRCWYLGTASSVDYYAFSAVNQIDGACP
jgi:hypothetical protein